MAKEDKPFMCDVCWNEARRVGEKTKTSMFEIYLRYIDLGRCAGHSPEARSRTKYPSKPGPP